MRGGEWRMVQIGPRGIATTMSNAGMMATAWEGGGVSPVHGQAIASELPAPASSELLVWQPVTSCSDGNIIFAFSIAKGHTTTLEIHRGLVGLRRGKESHQHTTHKRTP